MKFARQNRSNTACCISISYNGKTPFLLQIPKVRIAIKMLGIYDNSYEPIIMRIRNLVLKKNHYEIIERTPSQKHSTNPRNLYV